MGKLQVPLLVVILCLFTRGFEMRTSMHAMDVARDRADKIQLADEIIEHQDLLKSSKRQSDSNPIGNMTGNDSEDLSNVTNGTVQNKSDCLNWTNSTDCNTTSTASSKHWISKLRFGPAIAGFIISFLLYMLFI